MVDAQIIVLGGGPAGGAAALGLVKLGYQVTLISEPRPFQAVEGISERVVEGLRAAGFEEALSCLPEPTPRSVTWQGEASAANTERLLERQRFDQGVLCDLRAAGVCCVDARITKVDLGSVDSVRVTAGGELYQADFLVEARGRSAPAANIERMRGPETVSLLQHWQGDAEAPASAVQSFEQGWAWMARLADGSRYLQLTYDVKNSQLPAKAELVDFCSTQLRQLSVAEPFLANAVPTGQLHARTSTPVLCLQTSGRNWLRVGDAAMAVDPLSGNGIFQALSSSMQAPAVINTLLAKPQYAQLARDFHQQRVTELFLRFARIGRDFYAMESQWEEQPFWSSRRCWPDDQQLHENVRPEQITIESRPVLRDLFITPTDVVVTPDQPNGLWHITGVELAPVVQLLQQKPLTQTLKDCLLVNFGDSPSTRQLYQWAFQQGFR